MLETAGDSPVFGQTPAVCPVLLETLFVFHETNRDGSQEHLYFNGGKKMQLCLYILGGVENK